MKIRTRNLFLVLLILSSLVGCYKRPFQRLSERHATLERRFDSLSEKYQEYEAKNNELNIENVKLQRDIEFQDSLWNEFRLKYVHFGTGAILSTSSEIEGAEQFQGDSLSVKQTVLYNPLALSFWGNDRYGNCVTAEEAFLKACDSPLYFFSDNVVTNWAAENGVLNGARLLDVLQKMSTVGFRYNGTTYNNGKYYYVNFRSRSALTSALNMGPVKVGVTSTQLERAWRYNRGWLAYNFGPENITASNQHCVSVCGYGSLSWLAQQFNKSIPIGIDGNQFGYAIFTWGSIGIIDEKSLLNITREAWVRNPSTILRPDVSTFVLKAMGGEASRDLYLSHAHGDMDLRGTYAGGFGEIWICYSLGNGVVKLQARGAETKDNFLSHANESIELRADRGSGEEWIMHDLGNGEFLLEASGGERGLYLSHAYGKLDLRRNREGGETWRNIGQQ